MKRAARHRHLLLLMSLVIALVLALLWSGALAQDEAEEAIVTGTRRASTEEAPRGRHAQSDFTSRDLVSNQYLVVTVEIEKTSLRVKKDAEVMLILAPRKPSSAIDDLRVRSIGESKTPNVPIIIEEYAMPDPRFRRRPSRTGRQAGHEYFTVEIAEQRVFIPLTTRVVRVEIVPSPGRAPVVSSGGSFDPRPRAAAACDGADHTRFPACNQFPGVADPPVD